MEELEPASSTGTVSAGRDEALDSILRDRKNPNRPATAILISEIVSNQEVRWPTGIGELDRVLGGGAVEGAFVLIGGDPGIGKSTLVMQALEKLSETRRVLYVTGEESVEQVKLRASRLGIPGKNVYLAAETSLEKILKIVQEIKPDVLAVDSIQTAFTHAIESAPGSVSQVREVGARLMHLAKGAGILTFIVGHVTKDGSIAGPRVLEHMVDCVIYFEGGTGHSYRILRAVKNRFGSTNEIGVFEMRSEGLVEVKKSLRTFFWNRENQKQLDPL